MLLKPLQREINHVIGFKILTVSFQTFRYLDSTFTFSSWCYTKSVLCVISANPTFVVLFLALSLDNFTLNVTKAVTRGKAAELAKEKKMEGNREAKDKRNLYLAKEGLILPGSTAAQGLSKADLLKRKKAETEKKAKLENPNYFVSKTR